MIQKIVRETKIEKNNLRTKTIHGAKFEGHDHVNTLNELVMKRPKLYQNNLRTKTIQKAKFGIT